MQSDAPQAARASCRTLSSKVEGKKLERNTLREHIPVGKSPSRQRRCPEVRFWDTQGRSRPPQDVESTEVVETTIAPKTDSEMYSNLQPIPATLEPNHAILRRW